MKTFCVINIYYWSRLSFERWKIFPLPSFDPMTCAKWIRNVPNWWWKRVFLPKERLPLLTLHHCSTSIHRRHRQNKPDTQKNRQTWIVKQQKGNIGRFFFSCLVHALFQWSNISWHLTRIKSGVRIREIESKGHTEIQQELEDEKKRQERSWRKSKVSTRQYFLDKRTLLTFE